MDKVFIKDEPIWESEEKYELGEISVHHEVKFKMKSEQEMEYPESEVYENDQPQKKIDSSLGRNGDRFVLKKELKLENIVSSVDTVDTVVSNTEANAGLFMVRGQTDSAGKTAFGLDVTVLKTEADNTASTVTVLKTELDCWKTGARDLDDTILKAESDSCNPASIDAKINVLKSEPDCQKIGPQDVGGSVLKTESNCCNTVDANVTVVKSEPNTSYTDTSTTSEIDNNALLKPVYSTDTEPALKNPPADKNAYDKKTKTRGKYKTKPRKVHICEICNKKYKHKFLLTNHQRTHTGERPFKCETCNKTFSLQTVLKRHQRMHTGVRPFGCDVCCKQFACKAYLVEHMRIHTGENPFVCKVCNRRFKRKTHLSLHELNHMEKLFACGVCNKRFTQKMLLSRHEKIHTGEKPYSCETCKRQFAEKKTLIVHIRVHTGEKPYVCVTCDRGFSQKHNLVTHEQLHVRDMPYVCVECKKRFRLKSEWTKHIRMHKNK